MGTITPPNQEKRKYEKPHLSFNRRSVLRDICIAGINVERSKGRRNFKD